ncbi:hypothetical protein [Pseudomonas aeruginosa]|uniref:hypothetical protein n=1 Tax=Pseudomonas aeruginosa TaxID=287 RepID=UPI00068CD551|nr:hypothetical protein [Pseudomonas aeruginosa]
MTTSKIQMDQICSTSATVADENIRAGSQKKSSLSPAEGLQGESPDATCPSGGGSLCHPCPAHPAVEQAGGDERDLQGAQGERDGWGPLPIVQVPWNVFDRAVMWVEDRRRYGDDGTIVDDWKALKTIQRAALAQPSPAPELAERGTQHRFSTTEQTCRHDFAGVWWNDNGETKTGRECRHCGFFVADVTKAQAEQAEAERLDWSSALLDVAVLQEALTSRDSDERMKNMDAGEVIRRAFGKLKEIRAQHERIVGALRFERQQMDRTFTACINERDAALARVAELEAKLADLEKQEPIGWFAQYCETPMRRMVQWGTKVPDCAADTFYPLYAAPVAQAQHGVPGKYDDVLLPFLKSMEHELHANAGKGDRPGWLQMDRRTALLEIYYHLAKLQKATKDNDAAGIVEYAADVANMSMMLVDVCGLLAAAPGKEVGHE